MHDPDHHPVVDAPGRGGECPPRSCRGSWAVGQFTVARRRPYTGADERVPRRLTLSVPAGDPGRRRDPLAGRASHVEPAHRPRPGAPVERSGDAASLPAGGLATARPGSAARGPTADLVALHATPAGPLLGSHAGRRRHRAPGPAHDTGCHRPHLAPRGDEVAGRGQRSGRPGSRGGRPHRLHGLEARGARGRPGRLLPGRLAGAGRGLAPAGARLALRDRLHLWHHGRPEGRHAQPRQHPRDSRGLRAAPRAEAPPSRRDPAPLAPLRAGARPLLRRRHRRGGALRPLAQPACPRGGHA